MREAADRETGVRTAVFDQPLAIVDVETTGQSSMFGKIIEVAVLRVERGKIIRSFETLVNPGRYISPTIEALTGIGNRDVEHAPAFSEIARRLQAILNGAIFVAHNARFDYAFLRSEFGALGRTFSARCLCTVKLSRQLFPAERHHDLSTVIERHGFASVNRHRAGGDARAVYEFLRTVDRTCPPDAVDQAVRKILKTGSHPPGLPPGVIEGLPESTGVYTFYGSEGELLYVGKSVDIRDRVRSHFVERSGREMEMCSRIHGVEAHVTAGELGALLLESRMIKERAPLYNRMSRRRRTLIVARGEFDRNGYLAVSLEDREYIEAGDAGAVLGLFKSKKQALEFLDVIAREFGLCKKLLGMEQARGSCFGYHLHHCRGACVGEESPETYNPRVEEAFAGRKVRAWPYAGPILIEETDGRSSEVFVVDNWCLLASGKRSEEGFEDLAPGSHRFDYDSYKILHRYLSRRRSSAVVRRLTAEQARTLLASTVQ
jgi:DNA polymerase-3 subunit epsilon